MAAWMVAATEPRGGIRASISRPSLTRALAMEMTTLPARGSRKAFTVGMALSHGVATTTTSAAAAPSLSAPSSMAAIVRPLPPTSPATRRRPFRVARADGDPDAGFGQPDGHAATGRPGSPEDSYVHGHTFA